jgi:hypothetical protein
VCGVGRVWGERETMDDRQKQIEIAVKNPEMVAETESEIDVRKQAEQLYYNSGGRGLSGVGGYEAGWKAAKAHYENREQ